MEGSKHGTCRKRKCGNCGVLYNVKYLPRHKLSCKQRNEEFEPLCINNDNDSNNENETFDINDIANSADINVENDRLENDDTRDELIDEIHESLTIEDIDESFLESFADDGLPPNTTTENPSVLRETNKSIALVSWICLFLTLWQFHFNITDGALEAIIKFIKLLFTILEQNFYLSVSISASLPSSLYMFHKFANKRNDNFKKYVVCLKCFKLHDPEKSYERFRDQMISKKCDNILFPNHPQPQHRKQCGQLLMREVKVGSKNILLPFKTYCYKPLKLSINRLFNRPGFVESCSSWKDRQQEKDSSILVDVYDGRIWHEFEDQYPDFYLNRMNLTLMINVDWFAPYKHVKTNSIGAIYAVILNLPRSVRFKKENVILIGLIPNMTREPPTNPFMEPVIDELQEAWNGGLDIQYKNDNIKIRCCVLCAGCDIPASRKLCGFLGHSAKKGCNKCEKEFPGAVGNMDYSGFNTGSWTPRNNITHREQMMEICSATTKSEKERLESLYGTRYTVFSLLPYFDCIRMTPIDPMHNLFCGTGKRMIQIWRELGFLNKKSLAQLQKNVESVVCSSDVGKLPSKIEDFNFQNFTADETKNWTLVYSIYALKDILPEEHLNCWRKFVMACTYLCNRVTLCTDITIINGLLISFCRKFEELYGKEKVTPNMHLHPHLADCILDFGPIYNFWLFSFERYNGILGSLPNNKKDIGIQMMRRFDRDLASLNIPYPEELKAFSSFFSTVFSQKDFRGSINDHRDINIEHLLLSSWKTDYASPNISWCDLSSIFIPRNPSVYHLSAIERISLENMYKTIYPNNEIVSYSSAWKMHNLHINTEIYGSIDSRSVRSSNIMAFWCGKNGKIQNFNDMYTSPRPGKILYFLKHTALINGRFREHVLARIDWYSQFDQEKHGTIKDYYGQPVYVYRDSHFEMRNSACFMPVQRIFCKFVHAKTKINSHEVLACIARFRHHSL